MRSFGIPKLSKKAILRLITWSVTALEAGEFEDCMRSVFVMTTPRIGGFLALVI